MHKGRQENTHSDRSFADSKRSLIATSQIIKCQQAELVFSRQTIGYQSAKTYIETTISQHPNLCIPAVQQCTQYVTAFNSFPSLRFGLCN